MEKQEGHQRQTDPCAAIPTVQVQEFDPDVVAGEQRHFARSVGLDHSREQSFVSNGFLS